MASEPIQALGSACTLQWARYGNGRVALRLIDAQTGEPLATASVNVPEIALDEDEIALKDYAENAGLFDDLVQAGIVEPTGRLVPVGYVTVPVVKIRVPKGAAS